MYMVIDPKGNSQVIPGLPTLEDLQKHVDGYITAVSRPAYTAFCNEEGEQKNMPYNFNATLIVGTHLLGPVVLVGPPDEEGDDTSLSHLTMLMVLSHILESD